MAQAIQIKICGLQPGDDLAFTTDPLVSHIGIIFVEKSRRYVPPMQAAKITGQLAKANACRSVGVFVDTPIDVIERTIEQSGIEVVQLHGNESVSDCAAVKQLGVDVWKALSVPLANADPTELLRKIEQYQAVCDALLLDAQPPKDTTVTGGHGVSFDWRMLGVIEPYLNGRPWWIAGGIHPDNVRKLLSVCRPTGIDISSGVETNGRKDLEKIQQLLKAVNGV
ncbi:phosphoribosylanthranilate isomerase [Alicyclobacillus fodiniaquatilis]|uniref:N-(5'-phosphoribosyl)anthranilate isomerase n=1 Tax=Alicyclobacillus fodiniaquatilis TaxID=1661150 RepID=A0ABW4JK04_9BACL